MPAAFDSIDTSDRVEWMLEMPMSDRPWSEMWTLVLHNLHRLEITYSEPVRDSAIDLKCDIQNFAISAFHLQEHVRYDPALPPGVGNRIAGRATGVSEILAAGDLANTSKHYKRSIGGRSRDGAARIVLMTSAPSATVRWDDPSTSTSVQKDVLVFASEVTTAWTTLLKAEGLLDPSGEIV